MLFHIYGDGASSYSLKDSFVKLVNTLNTWQTALALVINMNKTYTCILLVRIYIYITKLSASAS